MIMTMMNTYTSGTVTDIVKIPTANTAFSTRENSMKVKPSDCMRRRRTVRNGKIAAQSDRCRNRPGIVSSSSAWSKTPDLPLEFRSHISRFERYKYFRFWRPYWHFRLFVVVSVTWWHFYRARHGRKCRYLQESMDEISPNFVRWCNWFDRWKKLGFKVEGSKLRSQKGQIFEWVIAAGGCMCIDAWAFGVHVYFCFSCDRVITITTEVPLRIYSLTHSSPYYSTSLNFL